MTHFNTEQARLGRIRQLKRDGWHEVPLSFDLIEIAPDRATTLVNSCGDVIKVFSDCEVRIDERHFTAVHHAITTLDAAGEPEAADRLLNPAPHMQAPILLLPLAWWPWLFLAGLLSLLSIPLLMRL